MIAGRKPRSKSNTLWKIFFLGFLDQFGSPAHTLRFPDDPLTVSFFTKGSEDKSKD